MSVNSSPPPAERRASRAFKDLILSTEVDANGHPIPDDIRDVQERLRQVELEHRMSR